jgi:hypothetical protein
VGTVLAAVAAMALALGVIDLVALRLRDGAGGLGAAHARGAPHG